MWRESHRWINWASDKGSVFPQQPSYQEHDHHNSRTVRSPSALPPPFSSFHSIHSECSRPGSPVRDFSLSPELCSSLFHHDKPARLLLSSSLLITLNQAWLSLSGPRAPEPEGAPPPPLHVVRFGLWWLVWVRIRRLHHWLKSFCFEFRCMSNGQQSFQA